MFIMIALGASDSMRGIFSGIFENHFTLSKSQVSLIVTISYIGNLVFILFGSRLADKYDKKKVCMGILIMWMVALLIYIFTDNFYCLLLDCKYTFLYTGNWNKRKSESYRKICNGLHKLSICKCFAACNRFGWNCMPFICKISKEGNEGNRRR